jgi:hypothetical protein
MLQDYCIAHIRTPSFACLWPYFSNPY